MARRDVLIVNDDRPTCDLLRQIFEGAGFSCRLSGDGYDALEIFKDWRPPLIVTDVSHPGLSGTELLREARAVDGGVSVVVLTAGERYRTECLELGADAFLLMPAKVDELLLAAEQALKGRSKAGDSA